MFTKSRRLASIVYSMYLEREREEQRHEQCERGERQQRDPRERVVRGRARARRGSARRPRGLGLEQWRCPLVVALGHHISRARRGDPISSKHDRILLEHLKRPGPAHPVENHPQKSPRGRRTKEMASMAESAPTRRVCIGGGAGFIGSHLAKRMKSEGWHVVCADWKDNEFMKRASSPESARVARARPPPRRHARSHVPRRARVPSSLSRVLRLTLAPLPPAPALAPPDRSVSRARSQRRSSAPSS